MPFASLTLCWPTFKWVYRNCTISAVALETLNLSLELDHNIIWFEADAQKRQNQLTGTRPPERTRACPRTLWSSNFAVCWIQSTHCCNRLGWLGWRYSGWNFWVVLPNPLHRFSSAESLAWPPSCSCSVWSRGSECINSHFVTSLCWLKTWCTCVTKISCCKTHRGTSEPQLVTELVLGFAHDLHWTLCSNSSVNSLCILSGYCTSIQINTSQTVHQRLQNAAAWLMCKS